MEQFQLVNLFKNIDPIRNRKFHALLTSCRHIVGDCYISSEEVVYIKNYYKYLNGLCELKEIEIYKVKNNRFYRVFYCDELKECCIEFYPLSEAKKICLKESKRYSESNFDLSIFFKDGEVFNLNSLNDTCDGIGSDVLSSLILDVYHCL